MSIAPQSFLFVQSLLGLTRGSAQVCVITKAPSLHQRMACRVQCTWRSASQDKAISVTLGGERSNEAVTGAPTRLSQNRTFFLKKLYWDLSKLQQVETRDRLLGPTETGFIALKSNRTIKSSVCKSTVLLRLQLAGNF